MPIPYYNTSAPSNGSSNSINITATNLGLRDFLLKKNIQNPIRYPQLPTSVNGSPKGGEPFLDTMVGSGVVIQQNTLTVLGVPRYNNAILMNHYKNDDTAAPVFLNVEQIPTVPIFPTSPNGIGNYQQEDITQYGLLAKSNFSEYRKKSTLKNLYLDATKQVDMADYVSLQPIQANQQLPSYDQAFGQVAGSSTVTGIANVLGSVLNGQGVGIGAGGIESNFDIRSSLAGRVLGATGLLNDTKLGTIGGQQLALALANNAAFNTQQAILGKLNIQENITSLLKGEGFAGLRPDYKITVPDGGLGAVIGTAQRILGFTLPKSEMVVSPFITENNIYGNINKANGILNNTGKGQREALKTQMDANLIGIGKGFDNPKDSPFRSGYSPAYTKGDGDTFIREPKIYAYYVSQGKTINGFVLDILNPFGYGTTGGTGSNVIPEISYKRTENIENYGFVEAKNDSYGITTGEQSKHIIEPTFSWVSDTTKNKDALVNKPVSEKEERFIGTPVVTIDKKTMIGKTQLLFNSKGMKNILSRRGDSSDIKASQIQTSVVNGAISKGSGVLQPGMFDENGFVTGTKKEPEDIFCRAWTTYRRYDSVKKLVRHNELNHHDTGKIFADGKWRLHDSENNSVLEDTGFVKIAPYKSESKDGSLTRSASLPKKYMFSIENLAWAGAPAVNLLPVEQGPGDLISGKFGRIMWFPPYDLTFSESSSVNLESTNFIGRGEPIYTYNNTERTGNLSFKVIIDHPSIFNAFQDGAASDGSRGPSDEFIASFFAGCIDLDPKWGGYLTQEEIDKGRIETIKTPKTTTIPKKVAPDSIKIFFPNDVTQIDSVLFGADSDKQPPNGMNGTFPNAYWYECGTTTGYLAPGNLTGIGNYNGEPQPTSAALDTFKNSPKAQPDCNPAPTDKVPQWPDRTDYGLNGTNNKLGINGKDYTNPEGWNNSTFKNDLAAYLRDECPKCKAICTGRASKQGTKYGNERLAKMRAESMQKWLIDNNIIEAGRITIFIENPEGSGKNYGDKTCVDQEEVKKDRFAYVRFENEAKDEVIVETIETQQVVERQLNQQVKKRFYSESDFFEKLEKTNKFIFDSVRTKIKYFHPSFHSTTPEGFNSRLTFLLQCTRQGATIPGTESRNLAFGPQPVCILRIGDFYNTKIMMDNVSFDFEPLVWDLNPEGIGVQPMIANVTISFKYIGGSSLVSPINKLQNALSFNYFANNQVFDPRADIVAKTGDERPTFKLDYEKYKDEKKEAEYKLVPGLDPTTQSLGSINSAEVPAGTTTPPDTNQPATADKTNSGPPPANNQFKDITLERLDYYDGPPFAIGKIFEPYFKWPANKTFNEDYIVSGTLTNNNNPTETYSITILHEATSVPGIDYGPENNKLFVTQQLNPITDMQGNAEFYSQSLKIDAKEMTPAFTGFTSGASYTFTTVIKNSVEEGKFTTPFASASATTSGNTSTGGELKITSVILVETENIDDKLGLALRVGVANENIYKLRDDGSYEDIATQQQKDDFVNKGLRITVEKIPSDPNNFIDETIKPSKFTDNNGSLECIENCVKTLDSLCLSKYNVGTEGQDGVTRIKKIDNGNYMLSVYHAGTRVGSKNFVVGDANPSAPSEFDDDFLISQLGIGQVNGNSDSVVFDLIFTAKSKTPTSNANRLLKLSKDHTADVIINSGGTDTKIGTLTLSQYNTVTAYGVNALSKSIDGESCQDEQSLIGKISDMTTSITWNIFIDFCNSNESLAQFAANAYNQPDVSFKLKFDNGAIKNRGYNNK